MYSLRVPIHVSRLPCHRSITNATVNAVIHARNASTDTAIEFTASPSSPPSDEKTYYVYRTPSQQLPVYQKKKKNGLFPLTEIKKVSGNVEDLKAELQQALMLPDGKIRINPVNKHIIIKALVKNKVAAYLEQQRF